jgi:DNA-binding MarR family transcriptional regulator
MHSRTELLSLGELIKHTHSLMSIVLEPSLLEREVTYTQYLVLMRLRRGTAVNPKEISAQIRYDRGALTRVVDQLVDRGLLERVRCDRDRRKVRLRLTPAAGHTIDGLMELMVGKLTQVLGDFGESEFRTLQHLLVKLSATLELTVEAGAAAATMDARRLPQP